MKIAKILIYLLIFFVAGEIVVRIEKSLKPFEDNDKVKIAVSVDESTELSLLKQGKLPIDDSDLRIMILGDSYIHGGGIDMKKNFSHRLKQMLGQSKGKYRNIYVLDVSRPANNNLDNYNTYFEFVDSYKPNIVFLGYNLNDINDNLDKTDTISTATARSLPVQAKVKPSAIKRIYNILYKSELVHNALFNFNKQLKSFGYIIPKSEFGHILHVYVANETEWIKSKTLLSEMITDAEKRKVKFVTLIMPEFDLLDHPKIFSTVDANLIKFLKQFPNNSVITGRDLFKGTKSSDFVLSRYDGHPNEKAHFIMADYVYNFFKTDITK